MKQHVHFLIFGKESFFHLSLSETICLINLHALVVSRMPWTPLPSSSSTCFLDICEKKGEPKCLTWGGPFKFETLILVLASVRLISAQYNLGAPILCAELSLRILPSCFKVIIDSMHRGFLIRCPKSCYLLKETNWEGVRTPSSKLERHLCRERFVHSTPVWATTLW